MTGQKLYHNRSPVFGLSSSMQLISRMAASSTDVPYHLHTLFLFTKSDISTTLIPTAIFALGTAPVCASRPVEHSALAVFWLWLVLLQFNLINQTVLPEEDVENKPWRPIPSGRISLQNAIVARWVSILACGLVSAYLGTPIFVISVVFTCMASVYNFYDGDRNGFIKNFITGFGSCSLALGATLVAACNAPSRSLSETLNWGKFPELIILFCILVTTVHAQDFRDVEGDRSVGRRTIPMIIPEVSRVSMPITLPAWSIAISVLLDLSAWVAVGYFALSMAVGLRFVIVRRGDDDRLSYNLYNAWLSSTILLMVLFKRQAPPEAFICSTHPPLVPLSLIPSSPKCMS